MLLKKYFLKKKTSIPYATVKDFAKLNLISHFFILSQGAYPHTYLAIAVI